MSGIVFYNSLISQSKTIHMYIVPLTWELSHVRLQYPLKCSEVCFEVQRSAYFAALGLHCRRTWVARWEGDLNFEPDLHFGLAYIPLYCQEIIQEIYNPD